MIKMFVIRITLVRFQGIPSQFHDLIGYDSFAIILFIKNICLEKRMKIDKEFVFFFYTNSLNTIMKLG